MSAPRPHQTTVELPEWEGYRRQITTRAAFEQRHDSPSRDYGIKGVEIHFSLIAADRAVQWELLTDCFLPDTRKRMRRGSGHLGPTAGAVWWHERERPEWHTEPPHDECNLIGGPCYSDVGYLIGDAVYAAWAYGGLDGVFGKLRELLETDR